MKLSRKNVIDALNNVLDPEIGIDIVSLGFIYDVEIQDDNKVKVTITLTTPGCPLNVPIQEDITNKLTEIGASDVSVDVVWDPPWNPHMMSPDARKKLMGE